MSIVVNKIDKLANHYVIQDGISNAVLRMRFVTIIDSNRFSKDKHYVSIYPRSKDDLNIERNN